MPRKPRFHLPGIPVHLTQRGNNRSACFFGSADHRAYLSYLGEASQRYRVAVHAWVLMTNHVHVLATPATDDGLTLMMQWLGAKYVRYVNHTYRRTGSLWEGRYKACLVDSERYLFACMRYIELNPVRAVMVPTPAEYRWSSYHRNALGRSDRITQPHPLYQALGDNDAARREAYAGLFQTHPDILVDDIRKATLSGTPLGHDRFRSQIEAALGKAVGQATRGRPRKKGGGEAAVAGQEDLL